ncbi:MAG TPA: hypothetical protein VL995_14420, partial [Cellvibrio sp.]|nr:hypothetical protein [Cellvibrio sp.]
MIIRLFTFMAFVFIACGCHAEKRETSATKSDNLASNNEVQVAVELFSKSVSEKDVQLFIKLADPNGIHLVRKFTSGNLGGRGSELSALTDPQKMDNKFQFPVDNQTSYNIHIQFQGLPITSFTALPHRQLLPDADTTDF